MTATTLVSARKPITVPAVVALVAVVAALALGGAWLAITAFTAGHDDAGLPPAAFVGERIATSYGDCLPLTSARCGSSSCRTVR